ncbi:MAG: hypothetical protein PHY48_05300 [Candidatus Cloacimonetes bacterium]|nr:hypothetical protein [Candidatus Cloacimonadota bacterium]
MKIIKKTGRIISQIIPLTLITILTMSCNWLLDTKLYPDGYPIFLSISDSIDISDLLIGMFTAQVALVTLAITFSGLLIQLFNSGEKYLGTSLRDVILSRSYFGFTLLSLMGTSLFSSILSYYYVARHHIVATISLFIINVILVFVIFCLYVRNATKMEETKRYVREKIVCEFQQAINDENNLIGVLLK